MLQAKCWRYFVNILQSRALYFAASVNLCSSESFLSCTRNAAEAFWTSLLPKVWPAVVGRAKVLGF